VLDGHVADRDRMHFENILVLWKMCMVVNNRRVHKLVPTHYSEDPLFGLGLWLGLGVRVRIAYVRNTGLSE